MFEVIHEPDVSWYLRVTIHRRHQLPRVEVKDTQILVATAGGCIAT